MTTPTVTPAVNIRYPFYKDPAVKVWAYVVDKEAIDPLLMQQKNYILGLYRTSTLSEVDIDVRHQAREYGMSLLKILRPLWTMFEYEYKYHELFQMFDDYLPYEPH